MEYTITTNVTITHNKLNILLNHTSEMKFYPIKARPADQKQMANQSHSFHKDNFFLKFNFLIDVL